MRSTVPAKVRENKDMIPAYDDYKNNFDMCDRFNVGLHGHVWPFKRGGKGISGEYGCQHDFIMGCVLQNIHHGKRLMTDKSIVVVSL